MQSGTTVEIAKPIIHCCNCLEYVLAAVGSLS